MANEILEIQSIQNQSKYNIEAEFNKSIHNNVYYKNLEYLLQNSQKLNFKKTQWYRNPQLFCLDNYENISYYRIILLVNLIGTQMEFHPDYITQITTPTAASMIEVISI